MNKKKKILILLIVSIVVLVIILIARSFIEKHRKDNFVYTSIEQFETPEDVIKYLDGEYIKQTESTIDEIKVDIYVKLKINLDVSNQEYYNKVMDMVAYVLDYNSFRLIDNEQELLITVICDNENKRIKKKYINGDSNYFGNQTSNNNYHEFEEIETTDFNIQSPEIIELINNGWKSNSVNFGTKTGVFGKYDVYDNGKMHVRNVYKKVFNIVLKKDYQNEIVNGITTKMTNDEIIEILGEPTITSSNTDIFGYKGKDIYVFFSYGDISIYRVDEYNSMMFAETVEKYINNELDVKTFVSNITDIWPDYDQYDYNESFVNLVYALKGIKIQFNVTGNHGVIVYNNYDGQILKGITKDNINLEDVKDKVFFENTNTVLENEIARANYYEVNYD